MSIRLENVNYIYGEGTGQEKWALKNINLTLHDNEFVGIVGHTGSGKSTLTQLLNGLEKPSSGQIFYNEQDIQGEGFSKKELRQKVGLVFQYPEHQLFEVSVIKDVEFGPRNLGLNNLEILELLQRLHRERNIAVILVSHSMDDVARYAERILVMNQGELVLDGAPEKVFRYRKELREIGLDVPQSTNILYELRDRGMDLDVNGITPEQAAQNIADYLRRQS